MSSAQQNAFLPTYRSAHGKATSYVEKGSKWLLLSSHALRLCIAGQEILRIDGKPLPMPEAFTRDDTLALSAALIAPHNCDAAAEKKALAKFKGNLERERPIINQFRNDRKRLTRDVSAALSMAKLASIFGKDVTADYGAGNIHIPAAWFLPLNAADSVAQEALGEQNPLKRMLAPTNTQEKAEISYFTVEGYLAFQREVTRCLSGKAPEPSPHEYVSLIYASVNASGLQLALDTYQGAKASQEKAKEAKEKASTALENAKAAQDIVDAARAANASPDIVAKVEHAATVAKAVSEQAASEAAQALMEAQETTPKPAQRAPHGTTSAQEIPQGVTTTIACDFLMKIALDDDGKRNFAPAVMEHWQNLANAVWRNPNLAQAFLIERNEVLKEQDSAAQQKRSA